MSGWDASSRPSWDPQGGPGENTQSFGVPDFPEDNGGFPSSSSPGTPPAIFLQDYDQNDVVQDDFGSNDFRIDFGSGGYGSGDSRQDGLGYAGPGYADPGPGHPGPGPGPGHPGPGPGPGYPGPGPGQGDFSRDGFGPQDDARRGYGHEDDFGYREYGQRGPAAPQDNSRQDYSRQDNSRQDYSRQNYSRQDNSRQDYPRQGPARDEASGSYPAGPVDSRGQADGEYAARMDPALRDFFAAPPPARQDRGQPGSREQQPGPRGYPGQGLGQGPGQGAPGGPPGYGQANGYRQPNCPMQPAPHRWDNAAPRPGSRSARHQETHVGGTGRDGRSTAVIVIAVVLVLGIAVGAYLLWRSKPAAPAAQNVPTTAPTSGSNVAKNPSPAATPAGRGAATTRYTQKTPATAGGYTKVTSVPAAVGRRHGTTSAVLTAAGTGSDLGARPRCSGCAGRGPGDSRLPRPRSRAPR